MVKFEINLATLYGLKEDGTPKRLSMFPPSYAQRAAARDRQRAALREQRALEAKAAEETEAQKQRAIEPPPLAPLPTSQAPAPPMCNHECSCHKIVSLDEKKGKESGGVEKEEKDESKGKQPGKKGKQKDKAGKQQNSKQPKKEMRSDDASSATGSEDEKPTCSPKKKVKQAKAEKQQGKKTKAPEATTNLWPLPSSAYPWAYDETQWTERRAALERAARAYHDSIEAERRADQQAAETWLSDASEAAKQGMMNWLKERDAARHGTPPTGFYHTGSGPLPVRQSQQFSTGLHQMAGAKPVVPNFPGTVPPMPPATPGFASLPQTASGPVPFPIPAMKPNTESTPMLWNGVGAPENNGPTLQGTNAVSGLNAPIVYNDNGKFYTQDGREISVLTKPGETRASRKPLQPVSGNLGGPVPGLSQSGGNFKAPSNSGAPNRPSSIPVQVNAGQTQNTNQAWDRNSLNGANRANVWNDDQANGYGTADAQQENPGWTSPRPSKNTTKGSQNGAADFGGNWNNNNNNSGSQFGQGNNGGGLGNDSPNWENDNNNNGALGRWDFQAQSDRNQGAFRNNDHFKPNSQAGNGTGPDVFKWSAGGSAFGNNDNQGWVGGQTQSNNWNSNDQGQNIFPGANGAAGSNGWPGFVNGDKQNHGTLYPFNSKPLKSLAWANGTNRGLGANWTNNKTPGPSNFFGPSIPFGPPGGVPMNSPAQQSAAPVRTSKDLDMTPQW